MEGSSQIYMVTLQLQHESTEEFIHLLPYQQTVIQRFSSEGKLLHYALSLESRKIWMVFKAKCQHDIPRWVASFPICKSCDWNVLPLEQFHTPQQTPTLCLN